MRISLCFSDERLNQISSTWQTARRKLLKNLRQQNYAPQFDSVSVMLGEREVIIPAYIPYIGHEYFAFRPRILCYAINQNLSKHSPWTEEWITHWAADFEVAIDRLNYAAQLGNPIPMKPYAEGFIPLVALIAIQRWIRSQDGSLPKTIDEVIAATNFIKFSTTQDASSSNIPSSWWRECGNRYVKQEIKVLRPDIIIGFGQKTVLELKRILGHVRSWDCKPELLGCRFPGRMPSIKSRPLSYGESIFWNTTILPLLNRMREPGRAGYHKCKILNYPGYFLNVYKSWNLV